MHGIVFDVNNKDRQTMISRQLYVELEKYHLGEYDHEMEVTFTVYGRGVISQCVHYVVLQKGVQVFSSTVVTLPAILEEGDATQAVCRIPMTKIDADQFVCWIAGSIELNSSPRESPVTSITG